MIAGLVFGFDNDTMDVFKYNLDWALESGVDAINLNILRPYPNSPIYKNLLKEGRMLYEKWWLEPFETRLKMVHNLTYNMSGVMTTYKPKYMSPRDLTEGVLWLGQEFYKYNRSIIRLLKNKKEWSTLIMDAATVYFYSKEYKSHSKAKNPLENYPN